MKKKNLILIFASISLATISNAQLVTSDPGQTAQNATLIAQNASTLQQAVETFQQLKKTYQQGEASYKEFVQMKDYMTRVEERLQNVGDIKDLKLNKINAILDKVLCIKQGNYYPKSLRYLEIIAKMQAAFLNCDNRELYNSTYSGVVQSYDEKYSNAASPGPKEINGRLNEFNKSLSEAEKTNQVTSAYNARMKLELGLKYKTISDTLVYMSAEIHKAINEDKGSDRNIALSPSERLKMMDLAVQYQIEALEYEEKSARLLKEASEADAQQQKEIRRIKRELATKQIIDFQL